MNLKEFDIEKFDSILERGLSDGLGKPGEQVCIEAAICQTLGLPHGDDPGCVGQAVRAFKISLNDSNWSSTTARAKGLRNLGIAQLGSDQIDQHEFSKRLAEKVIRVLIPKLFRQIFPNDPDCLAAADRCEKEGTEMAADAARAAGRAAGRADWADWAADAAGRAADAAGRAAEAAGWAADAAGWAAEAAGWAAEAADAARAASDEYLNLVAELALETLREMKSPGIALIENS